MKEGKVVLSLVSALALSAFNIACGGSDIGSGGASGGASSSGGSSASGGTSGLGGSSASGGASATGGASSGACIPKPTVGACQSADLCREFTNPGLTEEVITSTVCKDGETYAASCPKDGVIGECIRFCGKNSEMLSFSYAGDVEQLKVGCEVVGEWIVP